MQLFKITKKGNTYKPAVNRLMWARIKVSMVHRQAGMPWGRIVQLVGDIDIAELFLKEGVLEAVGGAPVKKKEAPKKKKAKKKTTK